MPPYRLLLHRNYERSTDALPPLVRSKAQWAQVQLGAYGRTPTVKGTVGLKLPWMRSPVQGSHYYLWWISAGDAGFATDDAPAILVHSIRHHDDTDRPLDPGAPPDYAPIDLASVDPRFREQSALAEALDGRGATFQIVQGEPGSGKTVALAYLARDLVTTPGIKKVRYITYSERLKNSARELFRAWGPEISSFITVHTINDVVQDLLGRKERIPAQDEARAFLRELEFAKPADLGPWRDFPSTLYTELRAHVIGRSFPRSYQLPKHREEQLRRRGDRFDADPYARFRGFDARTAELTLRLADRFRATFFLDQKLTADALDLLHSTERCTPWLAHSDAFIVDEVQDLTLLQIALLSEMARLRRKHDPERPFSMTVAGDESQIVQPTGFKWGVTKDLIRDGVGEVNPTNIVFVEQRRSPPLLAALIRRSWSLYDALPRELKPKQDRGALDEAPRTDEGADPGLALIVPPPQGEATAEAWRALLEEMSGRHGRALIDLTESLAQMVGSAESANSGSAGAEVLFTAREIKGLERSTILVHGLEALYARIVALTSDDEGGIIPQLEARRLIDQIRVALSRSTSRLVLLDGADATVFEALGLDVEREALQMALPELIEFLRSEEMTESEIVFGLLEEADDLFGRGRLAEAIRRNERARAIAARTLSDDLVRRGEAQQARLLLEESETLLAAGNVPAAQSAFAILDALRDYLDAELHGERLATLQERLAAASNSEFDRLSAQAARALEQREHEAAAALSARALELALRMQFPAQVRQASETLLQSRRRWAAALATQGESDLSPQIAGLLRALADDPSAQVGQQADAPLDGALRASYALLARRYEELPARRDLTHDQLALLLAQAAELPIEGLRHADIQAHLRAWIEESFAELGERVSLYHPWATAASLLAESGDYPELDEHLWDLENRLGMIGSSAPAADRFRAFLADYGGDAAAASVQWERLGESARAIESARRAGDLERAYRLIQSNKSAQMPEALSTAVRALRQLQQLGQKQKALTPAERRTLLEELARLHTILSADDEPPPD